MVLVLGLVLATVNNHINIIITSGQIVRYAPCPLDLRRSIGLQPSLLAFQSSTQSAVSIFGRSGLNLACGLDTQRCSVAASDNDAGDVSQWSRRQYDVMSQPIAVQSETSLFYIIDSLNNDRLTAGERLNRRAKLVRCEHWQFVVVELLPTTVQLSVDHSPLRTSPATRTRIISATSTDCLNWTFYNSITNAWANNLFSAVPNCNEKSGTKFF